MTCWIEMSEVIKRADARQKVAHHILNELALVEKWRAFGRPVVVGAVAYNLVVSLDIDMEIYCPDLRIEHGFQVISNCALHSNITKAQFSNQLSGRDQGLYWQLRYQHGDQEWKIDMWSLPENYPLPRSEDLIKPMQMALTPKIRQTILDLKEQRIQDPTFNCSSIDLYRAVLDGGVETVEEVRRWLEHNDTGDLTGWRPKHVTSRFRDEGLWYLKFS